MQNRREAHMIYMAREVGKIWRCFCWEKGNFVMINEFKYDQTWTIWPSRSLSLSLHHLTWSYKHCHIFSSVELVPVFPRFNINNSMKQEVIAMQVKKKDNKTHSFLFFLISRNEWLFSSFFLHLQCNNFLFHSIEFLTEVWQQNVLLFYLLTCMASWKSFFIVLLDKS